VTSTLSYCGSDLITAVKCLIAHAPIKKKRKVELFRKEKKYRISFEFKNVD